MPEMISIDPALAKKAEKLFRELGLDLQTAIHLFLLQSLRENGLPFTPRLTSPAQPAPAGMEEQQDADLPGEALPAPALPQSPESAGSAPEPAKGNGMEENTPESVDETHFDDVDDEPEGESLAPASGSPFSASPSSDGTASENASAATRRPSSESHLSALRQAFHDVGLIGMSLRRIRSLNQIYAMGEAHPHVPGWRESYISGDEPFALDFGSLRIEMGFRDGGSLRMMDGRLPDEVLEADAVFPRDLSSLFSPVIGQRLSDAEAVRVRRGDGEAEALRLHFANGCTLTFAPGDDWGALWLHDPNGSVMFAPDAQWRRVLGERTWQALR